MSWWKVSIALFVALLLGVAMGVVGSFVWSLRYAVKPASTFELPLDLTEDLATVLYQSVGVDLRGGHTVEVVNNGAVFDVVVDGITKSKRSIDIDMYIWEKGTASTRVTQALVERAHAGVACRIVIDAMGSPDFGRDVAPALRAGGCEIRTIRPGLGTDIAARDHRKIFVFDGQLAITGGLGVRDDWMGDGIHGDGWRDTSVRFTGPAVRDAQQAFAENWEEAGGPMLPAIDFAAPAETGSVVAAFVSSTGAPVITRAERLTQIVIASARHRLWIANAYFAPSQAILDLLERKAERGVDVRLLLPGDKSDSKPALAAGRELYQALRKSGVRVWEYSPVMMHSKTMVADDRLSVIGSINLDPLSLNKLDEDALIIDDPATAASLASAFSLDCEHAREIDVR